MWLSDSSGKDVETIDIADCSEAAIRALNAVAFGMLDAVEITTANVADLLYAAMKYDFKLVVDCCKQFIDNAIAKEDANAWVPIISDLYNGKLADFASKVVEKSKLFSPKRATAAFDCEAVTTLPFALFRDLLQCALKLSENRIWEQCVKWAKHNIDSGHIADESMSSTSSNMQPVSGKKRTLADASSSDVTSAVMDAVVAVLTPLKKHIRFPLMTHEFFCQNLVRIGLLSDAEESAVIVAKSSGKPMPLPFCSSAPRRPSNCFDPSHFKVAIDVNNEVLRTTGTRPAQSGQRSGGMRRTLPKTIPLKSAASASSKSPAKASAKPTSSKVKTTEKATAQLPAPKLRRSNRLAQKKAKKSGATESASSNP